MKSTVFNDNFGASYNFGYPKLTDSQEQAVLASLFEQLLIFDKITISADRENFPLFFLIRHLGVPTVERLIESGYINFMLWSPIIVSGTGRQLADGTIDESVIYDQPPIVAGSLSDEDLNPERNIDNALSHLHLRRDVKRSLKRKLVGSFVSLDGMALSKKSTSLVLDAYSSNELADAGLPFEKPIHELDLEQRGLLLKLGYKVLETAVLAKYSLKSYENYEHYSICKNNLANIGRAYKVSDNNSTLFQLENLPNLKEIYLKEHLDFDSVFKIRHKSSAKYYRQWINSVGESSNAQEITAEYINEIKGKGKFFETSGGKFLRNLGVFGASTALTIAVTSDPIASGGIGYMLGLLDNFWLDSILKGKNPSMFIDTIKKEIQQTG